MLTPRRVGLALLVPIALAGCDAGSSLTAPDSQTESSAQEVIPTQIQVPIHAVFSGPPNREPGQISLDDPHVFVQILDVRDYLGRPASANDVRMGPSWETGTPAEEFLIIDIDNDGLEDVQVRFNTQQLINNGHLGPNTNQVEVWGRDQTTGQLYRGVEFVTILPPPGGQPGSLETAPPNNGDGGVFMNLTPTRLVRVTSFDAPFSGTAGTTAMVEVWTRPETYIGFEASSAGWTLTQTVPATRMGAAVWAPIELTTPLELPANQTTAVYLHAVGAGGGLRYTGTAANPPQTTWSNADLTLFSEAARTGTASFAGGLFRPRTFSGRVNYLTFE